MNDGSTRGRPIPSILLPTGLRRSALRLPVVEEDRVLRIHHHQLRIVALTADIAANGGRGSARTAHDDI